jgi:hypothetical protein
VGAAISVVNSALSSGKTAAPQFAVIADDEHIKAPSSLVRTA